MDQASHGKQNHRLAALTKLPCAPSPTHDRTHEQTKNKSPRTNAGLRPRRPRHDLLIARTPRLQGDPPRHMSPNTKKAPHTHAKHINDRTVIAQSDPPPTSTCFHNFRAEARPRGRANEKRSAAAEATPQVERHGWTTWRPRRPGDATERKPEPSTTVLRGGIPPPLRAMTSRAKARGPSAPLRPGPAVGTPEGDPRRLPPQAWASPFLPARATGHLSCEASPRRRMTSTARCAPRTFASGAAGQATHNCRRTRHNDCGGWRSPRVLVLAPGSSPSLYMPITQAKPSSRSTHTSRADREKHDLVRNAGPVSRP